MRIILVDDSKDFLDVAEKFISADPDIEIAGRATSGSEAIAMAEKLKPDLVLMDIAMPGMNGLEATRIIKKTENPPKVIMLTLYDNPEYRSVADAVKADGYIGKSDFAVQLLPLIHKLFSEKTHAVPEKEKAMKQILVVDDSATMRRMIKAALGLLPGAVTTEAGNGLDAIEKMALKTFDLITLDLNMPDMHGMELLKFIRKHRNYTNTPVIIISTKGDEETRGEANAAGVTLYLTKPFDPHVLAKHVRELLEVTS